MIRPEIPEPFALLNYKNALFVVDDTDEAIDAVKNAAREITGFDHEISLKKSFIGNEKYLNMSHDPKGYDHMFRNKISLHPLNGKHEGTHVLSIQLRDGQDPIQYTMELTSEIYRQLKYSTDE